MKDIQDIFSGLFKEFGWFIWAMVGIAVLWFFTGGYASSTAHEGPYIKPPAPLDSGEAYGGKYVSPAKEDQEQLDLPDVEAAIKAFFTSAEKVPFIQDTSALSHSIAFDGSAGAQNSDPQKEYLRIVASAGNKSAVQISGLTIRGAANDVKIAIPDAAYLPVLSSPYKTAPAFLAPAGRAIVTSGRSPIGTSFQVNICSGYFGQFQSYTPDLRQDCPEPLAEFEAVGPTSDSVCRAFVEKLPRCSVFSGNYPSNISASCHAFVEKNLNYNSCVARHSNDADFYKDEWRIFLGQPKELWKDSREVLRLVDTKGETIDAIAY